MNQKAESIKQSDKEMVTNLDYRDIQFLVSQKCYHKIESKINMSVLMCLHIKTSKCIQVIHRKKSLKIT